MARYRNPDNFSHASIFRWKIPKIVIIILYAVSPVKTGVKIYMIFHLIFDIVSQLWPVRGNMKYAIKAEHDIISIKHWLYYIFSSLAHSWLNVWCASLFFPLSTYFSFNSFAQKLQPNDSNHYRHANHFNSTRFQL